jgi:hypothetical protein
MHAIYKLNVTQIKKFFFLNLNYHLDLVLSMKISLTVKLYCIEILFKLQAIIFFRKNILNESYN